MKMITANEKKVIQSEIAKHDRLGKQAYADGKKDIALKHYGMAVALEVMLQQ